VVHIQLARVGWLEIAVLAVVLLVDCVGIPVLDNGSLIDCITSESARGSRHSVVSDLDFSWTTNGADTCAGVLVDFSKSVFHLDLLDRVLSLENHN
jgi:hypothetical protein